MAELRRDLADMQRQQALQTAALREGLSDVHQQRDDIQLQRQALSVLGERCDKIGAAGGLADLKDIVMHGSKEAIDFHEELAEELASVVQHSAKSFAELAAAVDMERAARVSDVAELRRLLGACSGIEHGPPDDSLVTCISDDIADTKRREHAEWTPPSRGGGGAEAAARPRCEEEGGRWDAAEKRRSVVAEAKWMLAREGCAAGEDDAATGTLQRARPDITGMTKQATGRERRRVRNHVEELEQQIAKARAAVMKWEDRALTWTGRTSQPHCDPLDREAAAEVPMPSK